MWFYQKDIRGPDKDDVGLLCLKRMRVLNRCSRACLLVIERKTFRE